MMLRTNNARFSASPKLIGNFGEGLVTYNLIRKGFEVAHVDHVGADLIAERHPHRIAVSVKTRMFRAGSVESRGLVIESGHLEKLEFFVNRFGLEPVFAHAVIISDDQVIHLFMLRVSDIKKSLAKGKHGYCLRFGRRHLEDLKALSYVDYSRWTDESIGSRLFEETMSAAHPNLRLPTP